MGVWAQRTTHLLALLGSGGESTQSPGARASRAAGLRAAGGRLSMGGSLVWLIVRGDCSWGPAEPHTHAAQEP